MAGRSCRRCSTCGTDWPALTKYNECPVCETDTFMHHDGHPLHDSDVERQVAYLKFDAYYEKTRGVDSTFEGEPDEDPLRIAVGEDETGYHPRHEDGFLCWHCDTPPRRLPDGVLLAEVRDGKTVLTTIGEELVHQWSL